MACLTARKFSFLQREVHAPSMEGTDPLFIDEV